VDSRNDDDAAAAAAGCHGMWELEAVAAVLPAKKRRLRDTFDRLAACSPTQN
jgi:hypothetical protein